MNTELIDLLNEELQQLKFEYDEKAAERKSIHNRMRTIKDQLHRLGLGVQIQTPTKYRSQESEIFNDESINYANHYAELKKQREATRKRTTHNGECN